MMMGIFMTLHIFQISLLTNQTGCVDTRFLRIYLVHCLLALIVAGNAYPSGHLVPSPFMGLACAPIVETRFLELAMSLLDFSP